MMGKWVLCAAVLLAGCGAKPKVTEGLKAVTGKVTYKGQPVTTGMVTFVAEGRGLGASGLIGTDGVYTIKSDANSPGAKPGSYKVRIESYSSPSKIENGIVRPGTSAIPDKYGDIAKSGLTATVKDEASQTIDFTLAD